MPNVTADSGRRESENATGRRRQSLVALATIGCCGVGLVSLAAAFTRYFSSAPVSMATASGEGMGQRAVLYVAVFAGALVLAASALAFFRLRHMMHDAVRAHVDACPGCAIVDLAAFALCIWLGYGFVTEASPALGLSVLIAAGGLAAALGVHLAMTVDDRYGLLDAAANGRRHGAANRRVSARCGLPRQRATLFRVEWRADAMDMRPADDFTQRWMLTVASNRGRARSATSANDATRERGRHGRRHIMRDRSIGR